MAEAIDYAHKQHVLHRDIKPDNMLRDDNWLLLADFGITRMVSGEISDQPRTTSRGQGTPEFMAPEQARGRAEMTSDNCGSGNLLLAWSPDQSRLVIANQNQGSNSTDAVICTPDLKVQARFTLQPQHIGNKILVPSFTGIAWLSARYIVFSSREQGSIWDATVIDQISIIDVEHLQQRWPVVTRQDATMAAITNSPPPAGSHQLAVVHSKGIVVGQIDVTTTPPSWQQQAQISMTPPQEER